MPDKHHQDREKEVADLIRPMPYGLWQNVLWAIVLIVLLGGVLSHFVQYSDVVEAPVQLDREQPDVDYVAVQNGVLEKVIVTADTGVEYGDLLAVYRTTANYNDVLLLDSLLQLSLYQAPTSPSELVLPKRLELGSIAPFWYKLEQVVYTWKMHAGEGFSSKKIQLYQSQQRQMEKINEVVQRQVDNLAEEVAILKEQKTTIEKLYADKIESKQRLEKVKVQYLLAKSTLDNKRSEQLQNQLKISQFEEQILALQEREYNDEHGDYLAYRTALQAMQSAIVDWKEKNLIISRNKGVVTFAQKWINNSPVSAGELLFVLLPQHEGNNWYAHGLIPAKGAGKTDVGMEVQIRLDGFPYKEFGVLEGQIASIALVAKEDIGASYAVDINLARQTETSYQKKLSLRAGMTGTARILTRKRSLLSRMLDLIKGINE